MGGNGYRAGKYGSGKSYTKKYKAVVVNSAGVRSILEIEAESEDAAYSQIHNLGFVNTPKSWVRPAKSFVSSSVLNAANVNTVSENFIDSKIGSHRGKKKKQ